MGKHKIVKSAAAVALTASVVATAAAPGASAASYKTNSKDQLVYTKSGKLVKGWKVFGGKLYKNGKLAPAKKYKIIGTGAAQKLFYGPTLKKGYKTANSKTLLFKDGKLADGWKQAGKNERLYKNGKLDKGYTVYTNVEGDKFLYQNGKLKKGQKTATRGGETLLFVDGKLAKGYVLHEASKTLFNNGKVAEGLVKYPETDGKFYNDGKLANGEINGAEYKDGVLVAKDIASVKAINDTTVEVTFKKDQKDVKASDFKIEGLEVKNAATKQGDDKVVILTTSKQEAAKEYTLVYKEADTKTFTAKSDVIPTAISTSTASVQGTVGKEVTLKAQVTVAEGQSKAGIPVTFNIDGDEKSLNKDIVAEAYTDENGVATYSYTQYNNGTDAVAIYATGKPADRALANVYWGVTELLTVVENDTKGTTLANGDTKQYKVTYLNAKTGKPVPNAEVNVTFAENIGVTAEKVSTAKVTDVRTGTSSTPYQLADGNTKAATVKTDANGVAIFNVTGTNTKVTPIVFFDNGNDKVDATELQAVAANQVSFQGAQVTHQLTLTPAKEDNYTAVSDDKSNGREYTLKVLDQDGKPYAGGVVNLAFNEELDKDSTTTTKGAVFNQTTSGKKGTLTLGNVGRDAVAQIKLNANGEGTFFVANDQEPSYATPVAWIDQDNAENNQTGTLEAGEPSIVGAVTYFQASEIKSSVLNTTVTDGTNISKDTVTVGKTVKFAYDATNQNGVEQSARKKVTYTITNTGNEDITYTTNESATPVTVAKGGKSTVVVTTNATSQADNYVLVTATDATSVKVEATGYTLATVEGVVVSDKFLGTQTSAITFKAVLTAAELALNVINSAGETQNNVTDPATYNAILGTTDVTAGGIFDAVKAAVAEAIKTSPTKTLTLSQAKSVIENAVTEKKAADAIAKIKAVAKDSTGTVTEQDLKDAGVKNTVTANVSAYEDAIQAANEEEVDTLAEIQALVDTVNVTAELAAAKGAIDGNTFTALEKDTADAAAAALAVKAQVEALTDVKDKGFKVTVVDDASTPPAFSASTTGVAGTYKFTVEIEKADQSVVSTAKTVAITAK